MNQDFTATQQILKLDLAVVPRVLLVDDDEVTLLALQELVTAAGFEVCTAGSGAQALSFLEKTFTPVVITDLNMSEMDGLMLCRTIRHRSWPGYIYVLLLTSQDAEKDILAGLDAGADDYLSKRSSSAQLIARLRTAQRILTLERALKTSETEQRRLTMTDELTGAPNRRYFMQRMSRELRRVQRYGGELSLMSLDIDHFKRINDRHGHAAGDAVLQEFAQRMSISLCRDTDWCARMGGEEFAVVLEGTPLAGAAVVAEKLRRVIADSSIRFPAGTTSVTVSIGVSGLEAVASRKEATVESLLQQADRHLYISKENGRNRVTLPQLKPEA